MIVRDGRKWQPWAALIAPIIDMAFRRLICEMAQPPSVRYIHAAYQSRPLSAAPISCPLRRVVKTVSRRGKRGYALVVMLR